MNEDIRRAHRLLYGASSHPYESVQHQSQANPIPRSVDRNQPIRIRRDVDWMLGLLRSWGQCDISATAESANSRTFTIRVVDRMDEASTGVWAVAVYPSLTKFGAPDGGPAFGTATEGTLLEDFSTTGENVRIYTTNDEGQIVVPITYASAGNVYINTVVLGMIRSSEAFAYA